MLPIVCILLRILPYLFLTGYPVPASDRKPNKEEMHKNKPEKGEKP